MAGNFSLQNVQVEATKLLHVILSCPVGAKKTAYNYQDGQTYSKLLALQRFVVYNHIASHMHFRSILERRPNC